MIESTHTTDATGQGGATAQAIHRHTLLNQVLAWVGIVAGVLFIVAVVFVTGFLVARSGDGYGWHRGYQSGPGGPMGGSCPMMQMGPGGMGPAGTGTGGMMGPKPMPMPMPAGQPPAGQR